MASGGEKAASKAHTASMERRPRQQGPVAGEMTAGIDSLRVLQSRGGNFAVTQTLSGGAPLPPELRSEMESRFGQDFSTVRVHDNTQAHLSATGFAAHAYTRGNDIVFNANRYVPHAVEGRRLLAHELAHVVQQRRGGSVPALDPQAPHERSADDAAAAYVSGSGPINVAGGTGVGVACDNWFTKKYTALKEEIPPEYRDMAKKAVLGTADSVVSTVLTPIAPPLVTEGWGSSLVKTADDLAEGKTDQVKEDLKGGARDTLLQSVGGVNGVVKQVTELSDTVGWLGQENRKLREKAVEAAGGKDSFAGILVNTAYHTATNVLIPGAGSSLDSAAEGADALEASGSKDQFGRGSLTTMYANWSNALIKDIEEGIGGSQRDPNELFTPAEAAELKSMIGTQVLLAVFGAEEVKLALNAMGALQSLRGVVETIRHNKNWVSDPTFWSHLIGGVLSVVGLGSAMARNKIVKEALNLILRYGWGAAAIPPLVAMVRDYEAYLNGELTKDQVDDRMKKNFAAALNVVKDAVLHVSQSRGGKTPSPEEGPPPAPKTGATDVDSGTPPVAAKTTGGKSESDVTPAATKPAGGGTEEAAVATPTKPQPSAEANAVAAEAAPGGEGAAVTPIKAGATRPQSEASKQLDAALAKLKAEQQGTVTPLRPEKGSGPPSEPQQQAVPIVEQQQQKIAVGQTHGPGGTSGRSEPRAANTNEPALASLSGGGSSNKKSNIGPAASPQGSTNPPTNAQSPVSKPKPAATAQAKSGDELDLDLGPRPVRQGEQGHNELDLPPPGPTQAPIEIDTGPLPTRAAPTHNERDLGPATGNSPGVYRGSKPVNAIPGVRRRRDTFGEPSNEKGGTDQRTGINYGSRNAAEIDQDLRIDFDPVAGRPRSVSYRVDGDTDARTVQSDRQFSRDTTTEGAQPIDDAYTNSGYDRGHLGQREAFKGNVDVERAADQMTNVVPMHPNLNRGAGSPWRAAESRTIDYAQQYGSVKVEVRPNYGKNPQRLRDGTPIPESFTRTVIAPDGTVLEQPTFLNQ